LRKKCNKIYKLISIQGRLTLNHSKNIRYRENGRGEPNEFTSFSRSQDSKVSSHQVAGWTIWDFPAGGRIFFLIDV
jgi:hypothetical protein